LFPSIIVFCAIKYLNKACEHDNLTDFHKTLLNKTICKLYKKNNFLELLFEYFIIIFYNLFEIDHI
jgi:hypothetical protein